jgi:membrane-associated phospholipid phosphatase
VWDAKRFYDSERPITAIRFLTAGQTIPTFGATPGAPATVLGENWKPFQPDTFLTPPFPEFPSGHSCFSSAAASILKAFTGSNTFGESVTVHAGSSKVQPGTAPTADVTLTWRTFTVAAEEAGLSRIYGGIHFPQANIASQQLGKKIGKVVWAKSLTLFNGSSVPSGR